MAEVFAAVGPGRGGVERLVAIKRMLPHIAMDAELVAMFQDEARLSARIVSPHVVETLELGQGDGGEFFIVMELVIGPSLQSLAKHTALPAPAVVEWLAQTADGLDAAHEARTRTGDPLHLVHRDVCPHNILIGIDGRARLSDFGIAHALQAADENTPPPQARGKFRYFAPEMANGDPFDRRADIFSLGVVAWELLVGEPLFSGPAPGAVLDAVRSQPIDPVHTRAPHVPRAVSDCIARCLERDPERRYRRANQLSRGLRDAARAFETPLQESALGALVADARVPSVLQMEKALNEHVPGGRRTLNTLSRVSGPTAQVSLAARARSQPTRPRHRLWWVAAALAVALGAAASWYLTDAPPPRVEPLPTAAQATPP